MPRLVLFVFVCLVSLVVYPLSAQQVAFAPHDINPASEFPACAVMDVNKDGKLDIISGGFWYEAPKWTKHFLREVEVIRGRFDDYSNLEMDVNADGWTDIVSVNYRSASIFWIEHPGGAIKANPETPWTKHLVDNPGPMETGRLYDIDGDGKLDILPNGTTFAAWYEVIQEKGADGKVTPRFAKHDLPMEIAGHGVGFGDINGDSRGDIVGPHGWLEAPEDRRKGRWVYHQEWATTRDASVPMLVHDVDGDGDNDLIWGRGHRFGLYWLEQGKGGDGSRSWTWRVIDTSWGQPHSILLADLDGDKKLELVAGKRYMGHEGKDPGEYDLLCAYSYKFDPKVKAWSRNEIYFDHRAGFGLDPRAVDVDGDGDVDLVAADRSSLVLLENKGSKLSPTRIGISTSIHRSPPRYNHQQPLSINPAEPLGIETPRSDLSLKDAKSPAEYALRREHIQEGMAIAMGRVPDSSRRVPLDVKVESREEMPEYTRVKVSYAAEPGDRVPALLLVPKKVKLEANGLGGEIANRDKATTNNRGFGGRLPAMLCLHPTNVDGKAQTAALVGEKTRHYGHQLAERGFVCLIPDYPSFGDYKAYDFKQKAPGSEEPLYESGSMKAIWNNIRAVDLLESLGYVDIDSIGLIGHSLGGHNALFTAVFEPRIKAVVTSCGFTAFHDYYKGDLKGWTSDRYMPKIRDVYQNNPDKMPFDFPEVLAAIAPRGIYINAPLHDANFDVGGVRKCIEAAQPVFNLLEAKDKLVVEYPDCGHDFPDEVRERVYEWLKKELK